MRKFKRIVLILLMLILGFVIYKDSTNFWQWVNPSGEGLLLVTSPPHSKDKMSAHCTTLPYPSTWEIHNACYADITGDAKPECILLVWRPWQDWPIMQWSQAPSPIANNHDARGYSAHLILTQPDPQHGYRELWAGSALAIPILQIAVGDLNGEGENVLVALEGDYAWGHQGTASRIAIWRWNGFGFTLEKRSPPGRYRDLSLLDTNADGKIEILVR